MTPNTLFVVANTVAVLSWMMLILRPCHPSVLRWAGQVAPLLFAVIYAGILIMRIGRVDGDFNSLAGVAALFRDPWILLGGWLHYLAFDLLIGVWEVRDAATRHLPHWQVVPCLILTFFFGPAGWLLYQVVRSRSAAARESTHPTAR